MHDPSRVRVSGPSAVCAGLCRRACWAGYTPLSAVLQLRLVAHLSRWLEAEGLAPEALSPAAVERFIAARRAAGHTHYASARPMRPMRPMQPMIEYLHRLCVVAPPPEREPGTPLDALLERYRRYLRFLRLKPIHNLLEARFELLVVRAAHIKAVPGRKTDVRDAGWIADLFRHELLRPSFIPSRAERELRALTRYWSSLVRERAESSTGLRRSSRGGHQARLGCLDDPRRFGPGDADRDRGGETDPAAVESTQESRGW